jgi:hypothetical protein
MYIFISYLINMQLSCQKIAMFIDTFKVKNS